MREMMIEMMLEVMWEMMLETMLVDILQVWILVLVEIPQQSLDLLELGERGAVFCWTTSRASTRISGFDKAK
jgi:hypothetical protein